VVPVRPLSAEESLQTIEPALDALAYVHAQGFVHGHLKPGNIMAVGDCLKVSIAGVCRAGECCPTVPDAYTPPEGTTSAAGDVWSLGVTLVEALTQRLPDNGPTGAVVPETIPQPFFEIARDCLRSDPNARPTIADLAARLRPGAPPAKRPTNMWTYAFAAVAGLVLAVVFVSPWEPSTKPAQVQQSPPAPPAPAPQPAPRVQAAPRATTVRDEILERVLPEVPSQASRTIRGRVKASVRVRVDPSGNVEEAKLESGGSSRYFSQLALQAARRWKFAPASAGDPGRPREWSLQFEFSRTGTKAVPVRKAS